MMQHFFLTLLIPGYRALRRGDKRRAFAFQGVLVALFALGLLTPIWWSSVGVLCFLLAFLVACVMATRAGPADGEPARLRAWEWIYLIAPQCIVLLVLIVPSLRRPLVGLEVFLTPTHSNTPTLDAGDRFVVELGFAPALRGAMVVFRAPDGTGQHYIKRVVGVAGDVVAGGAAGVTVNGYRIRELAVDAFGPVEVPADHAFVIGDNLSNSRDSRQFGPIQERAITGRPLYVVWSRRWRKIGRSLR